MFKINNHHLVSLASLLTEQKIVQSLISIQRSTFLELTKSILSALEVGSFVHLPIFPYKASAQVVLDGLLLLTRVLPR